MSSVAFETPTPLHSRGRSRWVIALLALVVFVTALVPRVSGIATAPMQVDEKHWVRRAETLYKNLLRNRRDVTTHLAHPGVFPAAVLMTGEVVAWKYNTMIYRKTGTPGKFPMQTGARLGNALFSSLLPGIMFLALLAWTGVPEAFCVGILLALSPRTVDLSQIAHIDTIHAVVVTLAVLVYLAAIRRVSFSLKIVAGLLFGLCLLSKPTSIALIPAFIISKALVHKFWPHQFKEGPISWSDIWAVVSSLVIFVACYSRMWRHREHHLEWEGINRFFPELLFYIGKALQSNLIFACLVGLIVFTILHYGEKLFKRSALSNFDHLLLLTTVFVSWWSIFPASFENLAMYWMRVANLTTVQHVSFEGVVPPVPGGYLLLASNDLPPLIFIGILLSFVLVLPSIRKSLSDSERQIGIMSAVVALVWIILLSTSSKQAWRYAMPIVPMLNLLGVLTLCAIGRLGRARYAAILFLLVGQISAAYRAYPAWDLYQSPLAPPATVAYQLGAFNPRTGQTDALKYLTSVSRDLKEPINVTVLGDSSTFIREANKWFGADARNLRFGYFREDNANFILVQGLAKIHDQNLLKYMDTPVFTAKAKDVPVATVYAIRPPNPVQSH